MPIEDDDESHLRTCQQCFNDYNLRETQIDDGFCSDTCMNQHDKELGLNEASLGEDPEE